MTAADGDAATETSTTAGRSRPNPYWYVLLFSLPPGIGMAGFVASVTGETLSPLGVATGVVTTLAIALFVLLAVRTGEGTG